MYKTRFVFQLPLADTGKVAVFIEEVAHTAGPMPVSVFINGDKDTLQATATVTYLTNTSADSDRIISAWKSQNSRIQVERLHIVNPDAFESFAMSDGNGRAFRSMISNEVRALCKRGVGSAGISDYLKECEEISRELNEFVQSTRASI